MKLNNKSVHNFCVFPECVACNSMSATQPVSFALHAQSGVPSLCKAPRLPRRWKHTRSSEETTEPGGNPCHHPGTKRWLSKNGELSDLVMIIEAASQNSANDPNI